MDDKDFSYLLPAALGICFGILLAEWIRINRDETDDDEHIVTSLGRRVYLRSAATTNPNTPFITVAEGKK